MAEKFEVKWPLDVVRSINEQAGRMDEALHYFMRGDVPEKLSFLDNVGKMSASHPFRGQEVYIRGKYVHVELEDEEMQGRYVLPNQEAQLPEVSVRGIYQGIKAVPIHNMIDNKTFYSLVHKVAGEVADEPTDSQIIARDTYVLFKKSEISPALPINAHSFEDLQEDKLLDEIFEATASKHIGERLTVIREVGKIFTEAMWAENHNDELSEQRVSYLNSRSLLEDVVITARDFLQFEEGKIYFQEAAISDYERAIDFTPDCFILADGYKRVSTEQITPNGNTELYLYCSLANDTVICIPTKAIIEARPRGN